MATSKNKGNSSVNTTAVAVGVAGLAATAVGAYWLYGAKDAKRHRKLVSSWMLKARAEVMDSIEKLKDIDKEKYIAIVDNVLAKYAKPNVNPEEMAKLAKDMKNAWSHIQQTIRPKKRSGKRVGKKTKGK